MKKNLQLKNNQVKKFLQKKESEINFRAPFFLNQSAFFPGNLAKIGSVILVESSAESHTTK